MVRGTVLAFDFRSGEGKISGDDGARYSFHAREWHGEKQPATSQPVDFEVSGGDALAIYPLRGAPALSAGSPNRIAAALLAFFLGAFGIHKFYMGKAGIGATMLAISMLGFAVAGIPTALMHLVAVIESVIYLLTSDERFEQTYVKGGRDWF